MQRKIEYALMALKLMSAKPPGQLTTAKEVVDFTGAPFDPIARALQKMAQVGLLRSEFGVQGGYMIVKDLSRVTMHELMEVLTGPVDVVKCLNSEQDCALSPTCNIQSPVAVFNKRLSDFYRSVSLSEVLRLRDGA